MIDFWSNWEDLRDEIGEGEVHEDWNSKESGFDLKEWISMEERL